VADEQMQTAIQTRIAQDGREFFRRAQALTDNTEGAEHVFVIPLQKFEDGHSLLLLEPQYPTPSLALAACALTSLVLFVGVVVARHRVRRSPKVLREESILRDLQAGVLDVSDSWKIESANDRAEEILGTRIPMLGADWDDADPVSLLDLVETPFLYRVRDTDAYEPLEQTTVEQHRAGGLAFPYFARLKHDLTQIDTNNRGRRWISVKGSPLLDRAGNSIPRTFAVIDRVSAHTNARLEQVFTAWRRQTTR